jgi:hypothetical protein
MRRSSLKTLPEKHWFYIRAMLQQSSATDNHAQNPLKRQK